MKFGKVMKRTVKELLLLVVVAGLFAGVVPAQAGKPVYEDANRSIDERVNDLLSRMTLEEKVGQLNQLSGGVFTGPKAASDAGQQAKLEMVRQGKLGSFLNVLGARETRAVQKIAVEESRLGIPLLFAFDVIHGYRTIFPIPLAESCTWDPRSAEKAASIAAKEASSAGLHWTFAPMMDVSREPRWGRVMEGSGEDPYLGGMFAAARVRGFQGEEFDNQHVMACAKHFAAYGAPEGGREYNTVDMSRYALLNYYLPPYKAAVRSGVATVMNAFNIVEGIPASGNEFLIKDMLRGEWEFDGFIVSDWSSFSEMITHGYASDRPDAAFKAIMAGSDMDMESRVYIDELAGLVRSGKVPESQVDESVKRVLEWKFRLGLFEDPYKYSDEEREKATLLARPHRQAAREAAAESMVLLKNEGGLLPLSKSVKNVLVTGYLAESQEDVLDFWKGNGDNNDTVTILEGIRNKLPGAKVNFTRGYWKDEKESHDLTAELSSMARSADVIVAVIGIRGGLAGEARSLADISPSPGQMAMLRTAKASGKPVVVVVQTGRPMVLTAVDKEFPAILNAWIGGTEHGNGVADILFGDVNPSAKTTMSFPYAVGQIPVYYNHYNTGRPHVDGQEGPDNFWVSRYRDIPNSPLYPFGFGLSYTTYEYGPVKLSAATIGKDENLRVETEVRNTGKTAGKEIVQLYIRDIAASRVRPVKELKRFKKIDLKPGESKKVSFLLRADDLGFYDEDGSWLVEPGKFKIFVGPNSRDTKEADLELR